MEITGNEQRQAGAEQITMDQVSRRAEAEQEGGKPLMGLSFRVWWSGESLDKYWFRATTFNLNQLSVTPSR